MLSPLPAELGAFSAGLRAPGAPRTWLLLGPLARECALWDGASQAIAEQLRRVQPAARLVEFDLPGTGPQWRERSASQVGELLEQLRARALRTGLEAQEGPFGLIASSWAGCLATEWARRYPTEVGALVLISPAMRPFTRVLRSVPPSLWSTALALALGRRSPLERERRLWHSHTQMRELSPGLLQRWRELRRAHPTRARTGIAQVLAVWRYESSRRRPHQQVLLLAGKGDAWMDWRVSAAISRAWGAALRLHPQAGHDLLLDDPQWVARSLAEWLMPVGSGSLGQGHAQGLSGQ